MSLPSINAFNCGNIPLSSDTLPSSNEMAIRNNAEIGTIRRQATLKKAEASTSRESNLSLKDKVKSSRIGRFILLAWFFVLASAFLSDVVEANMFNKRQDTQAFVLQEEKTRYALTLYENTRNKDKKPYDNISELKQMGDKITIDTVPSITISKYTKNMDLTGGWQNVDSAKVDMYVNRATIFRFKMDTIDLAQFLNKEKLNQCAKDAAEQQAIYIDSEALAELYLDAHADNVGATAGRKSGLYNIGYTTAPVALTESNILRYLMMCQAVGDEQNWPTDNRWIVLPTWSTFLLNMSDIKDVSMTGEGTSLLVNGHRVGKIGNFTIYQSNLYTPVTDGAYSCYNIIFGHKSAISFASQLNEVTYFDKLEGATGKGMRGIQLYDWKTTKAESMGVLYARMG